MEQQPIPPPPPPSSPVSPAPYRSANIVDRAKNILITPKPEWEIIDREQTSVATVWASYVLPMLLIGAFATFIGFGLIGYSGIKWGAGNGLIRGLIYVVFISVVVFGMGAAIDVLAPSFAAERNWGKSYKLAAYSMTAAFLAGIFWLFPALWILVLICSLYSLYALYTGIAVIKKTTADKQVAYFAVVVLITVVLYILLQLLFTEIYKAFQPNPMNQFRNFRF
ncbi:MAG TPA: Yip1 family protein [Chitinophagaceae bacterium]|nr:Yip1 family protein [Chitinophagaceae bacterium]